MTSKTPSTCSSGSVNSRKSLRSRDSSPKPPVSKERKKKTKSVAAINPIIPVSQGKKLSLPVNQTRLQHKKRAKYSPKRSSHTSPESSTPNAKSIESSPETELVLQAPGQSQAELPSADSTHSAFPLDNPEVNTPASNNDDEQPSETIDWRKKFGFVGEVDSLFRTFVPPEKPRIPCTRDVESKWMDVMLPENVDEFIGITCAVEEMTAFSKMDSSMESWKNNLIIYGKKSTGKTSLANLLTMALVSENKIQHSEDQDAGTSQGIYVLQLDARGTSDQNLFSRIERFIVEKLKIKRKSSTGNVYGYIVIDNFHAVVPKLQQHQMRPIMEKGNSSNVRFILQCNPEASTVAEQIRQSSLEITLGPVQKIAVLEKILRICVKEKIGFTRTAIQMISKNCKKNIIKAIEDVQSIFVKYHYISFENVCKYYKCFSQSTKPLSIIEMCQPLQRCKICTLVPPCRHISLQDLYNRVQRWRSLYPNEKVAPPRPELKNPENNAKVNKSKINIDNNKVRQNSKISQTSKTKKNPSEKKKSVKDQANSVSLTLSVCPSFRRNGVCLIFNRKGRCAYNHPSGLHVIDTTKLINRCSIHTLPLPCLHCDNLTRDKALLQQVLLEKQELMNLIKNCKKEESLIDTDLYLHKKQEAKEVRWGSAKEKYDSCTKELETKLEEKVQIRLKSSNRVAEIDDLVDVLQKGKSKGVGKGNARPIKSTE